MRGKNVLKKKDPVGYKVLTLENDDLDDREPTQTFP